MKTVTASEAVRHIHSNARIFIHTAAATPTVLLQALDERANDLQDLEFIHLHTEGVAPQVKAEYANRFRDSSLFIGSNVRKAVQEGRADYIPIFLSETPLLFRRNILPLDFALIQVSPPDKHGFCSLGVSVDCSRAAVQTAKHVIAQINPNMPRSHGDGIIHISEIDSLVEVDTPIFEIAPEPLDELSLAIGKNVAEIIEDGATLQMGIGNIPNAVLASLTNHKRLGIHTEMFSDGIIPLVESGVITGEEKRIHPYKIVGTFAMGTRKLYDFIDDNPQVVMLDVQYVNDTAVIRRNPKVTAINSAIEIDLTGQICADSIGAKMYSGVGGQMDFVRGASLSEGGKPIFALPSTTSKGETRIVPYLKQGAGVVTTRAHVHYIVTEYGVVNLHAKSLRERAELLASIAHPNHRESLLATAHERFGVKSFSTV
ncbi:MAG: acetyl-CoA hydrolase/transferase C-terminal domain-containing protein [Chloroherpetonaceae bacterium]|nr:acetyl-CoA hydrolase/transferase C-terminal domain-containing protein [Chloroherpetonaceae bacterium]